MITVIAGVNGAGKSSVIGSWLRAEGADYFNPDEVAQILHRKDSSISVETANISAWQIGFEQLSHAIAVDEDYILETTLGGNSITNKLHEAMEQGRSVRVLYCGLESVDLHVQRVAERVRRGGHAIPTEKIVERYNSSVANLLSLIPSLAQLVVFDNSAPLVNGTPSPQKLFQLNGKSFETPPSEHLPNWARPIASVAIKRALAD